MSGEIDSSLLLENLKAIRADVAAIRSDLNEVAVDVRGLRSHMAGLISSDVNRDGAIASIRLRLDRIERRLELVD